MYSLEMNQEVNASDNRETLQQQTAATSTNASNKMPLKKKIHSKTAKTRPRNNASINQNTTDDKTACISPENHSPQESDLFQRCHKLGKHFQALPFNETKREQSPRGNKLQQQKRSFRSQQKNCHYHPLYQKMVTSSRSRSQPKQMSAVREPESFLGGHIQLVKGIEAPLCFARL